MTWNDAATWLLIIALGGIIMWHTNKIKSSREAYDLGWKHAADHAEAYAAAKTEALR